MAPVHGVVGCVRQDLVGVLSIVGVDLASLEAEEAVVRSSHPASRPLQERRLEEGEIGLELAGVVDLKGSKLLGDRDGKRVLKHLIAEPPPLVDRNHGRTTASSDIGVARILETSTSP